ncbi:hypothetical protein M407DRAFT_21220 [Tulasnella calospora MUT 4182]|uniref:Protein kinase domain-containing protein n=1 Tax=Tulasnella calospora MUT 4182 TaxID=1051891 RepID=A0A0C3QNI4_9AGAM|nr:hypothetical protein M407DRAFT_21220 [Tulasnella calospora MUT 4182]
MDETSYVGIQATRASLAIDIHAVNPAAEPTGHIRIRTREVLASLGYLRIDKARIKPLASGLSIAGGKADVEAAKLLPEQFSSSSEPDDAVYVAVKKLRYDENVDDDHGLGPFVHEVNLLKDLSHENVVNIVGFVQDANEGIAWLIFSWEKNGNLREFVRSANWELPERVSLINDVAKGLSYLHGKKPPICHGDLKSLNVLVNSACRAIITDFGSARHVNSMSRTAVESGTWITSPQPHMAIRKHGTEPPKSEITASGEFITMTGPGWTVRWAAPELLYGESPGLPSDIWALGWICWEAITGNLPFAEENDIAVILRIAKGDIPTINNDSQLGQIKALYSLMMDCWNLNPADRPPALKCEQIISWMHQVVPSDRAGNDSSTTRSSILLYALGLIKLSNGIMSEALNLFRQSLNVSMSVGDDQGQARAMRGQGDVYRLKSDYPRAERSYILAREIYHQIGDEVGQASSFKALGDIYRMRNDYAQAEDSYTKARGIYKRKGNHLGLAQSVQGLGHVYHMRNEYPKAMKSYIEARDVYSRIGDQLGLANSARGLGHVCRMRNEYTKAKHLYIEARNIYSRIGDQLGFANSVRGLGDVYQMLSEYSKAEKSYIGARDGYARIGEQLGLANSVRGLGDVYRMRNDFSQAERSYNEAHEIYFRLGYHLGLAQSVQGLGDVYRMRSDYSKAEGLYFEARDIYSHIGDRLCFANVAQGLGHVYSARREYSEAERLYLEAQEIYNRIGDTRSSTNISHNLNWLRRKRAQLASSREGYYESC